MTSFCYLTVKRERKLMPNTHICVLVAALDNWKERCAVSMCQHYIYYESNLQQPKPINDTLYDLFKKSLDTFYQSSLTSSHYTCQSCTWQIRAKNLAFPVSGMTQAKTNEQVFFAKIENPFS